MHACPRQGSNCSPQHRACVNAFIPPSFLSLNVDGKCVSVHIHGAEESSCCLNKDNSACRNVASSETPCSRMFPERNEGGLKACTWTVLRKTLAALTKTSLLVETLAPAATPPVQGFLISSSSHLPLKSYLVYRLRNKHNIAPRYRELCNAFQRAHASKKWVVLYTHVHEHALCHCVIRCFGNRRTDQISESRFNAPLVSQLFNNGMSLVRKGSDHKLFALWQAMLQENAHYYIPVNKYRQLDASTFPVWLIYEGTWRPDFTQLLQRIKRSSGMQQWKWLGSLRRREYHAFMKYFSFATSAVPVRKWTMA